MNSMETQPGTMISGIAYFDHRNDNEPKYREQTFDEFAASIRHEAGGKDGMAISAGLFSGTRATKNALARNTAIFDIEMNKRTGAVPMSPEKMADVLRAKGWQAIIYTSYNHTPELPRYRVAIALDHAVFFSAEPEFRAADLELDLYAMRLIVDRLEIGDVVDESKLGVASIFYLARCPEDRLTEAQVINVPGKPIRLEPLMKKAADLRDADNARRKSIAQRAQEELAARMGSHQAPASGKPIEKLRQVMPKLTEALPAHGYRYYKAMDRWLHPASTTGIPGIIVFQGYDGHDRMISFHGCDPLEHTAKAFGSSIHDIVDFEISRRWGTSEDAMRGGIRELCREYRITSDQQSNVRNDGDFREEREGVDFKEAAIAGNSVAGNSGPADRFQWLTSVNGYTPILNSNWLIKRLLPAEGLGVIYGRPGSGKTFTVMDLAMHVATGTAWRKFKVTPAAVSYISPEAGRLGANRVIGWCRHHDIAWPDTFRLSPAQIDLCSTEADARALIDDIRQNQPSCRLVVIDTLNRALAGGDENDGQDMGIFVRLCDTIAKELQAFVLVVHHSGKDASRGSRGHSSLLGAVSLELEVTREQKQPGVIKVTKMRDGEDGQEYGFDIESVELGEDEDGEAVSTGISTEADVGEAQAVREAQPSGVNQKILAQAFSQLVDDYGRPNPTGPGFPEPGAVRVIEVDQLVEFASGKVVGQKPAAARKVLRNALSSLQQKRYFVVNGGLLWRI